jgi:hypothetical protein
MSFWDWKSGYRFQSLDTTAQPGSLDAEAGIMSSTFDRSGLRLICGEADKTSEYRINSSFRGAKANTRTCSSQNMEARRKRFCGNTSDTMGTNSGTAQILDKLV